MLRIWILISRCVGFLQFLSHGHTVLLKSVLMAFTEDFRKSSSTIYKGCKPQLPDFHHISGPRPYARLPAHIRPQTLCKAPTTSQVPDPMQGFHHISGPGPYARLPSHLRSWTLCKTPTTSQALDKPCAHHCTGFSRLPTRIAPHPRSRSLCKAPTTSQALGQPCTLTIALGSASCLVTPMLPPSHIKFPRI